MQSIDVTEVTDRLVDRADYSDWLVAVVDGPAEAIADRVLELGLRMEESIVHLRVTIARDVVRGARDNEMPIVVSGASGFSDMEWQNLDWNRSRLERRSSALLLIDVRSLDRALSCAPNFMSWVGPSVWEIGVTAQSDDTFREERLRDLRSQFQWSDQELLAMVSSGSAPRDPAIAEWLALLGHANSLE
jgi:hypothetical protein